MEKVVIVAVYPRIKELNSLEEKVLKTIKKYKMLKVGDSVLVAFSGGPDSTALLGVLLNLKPLFNLKLHLFHLDHQIRDESKRWVKSAKEVAEKFDLPASIFSYNVPQYCREKKLSLEEGAREIRYQLLKEEAEKVKADKIALGHQADDQVETFLMRLFKGAGPEGLQAIPPARGKYIRPLIEVSRKEVEEYLQESQAKFVKDPSNLDLKIPRNQIRLKVLPFLERNFPPVRENILRTIQILKEEEDFLNKLAKEEFRRLAKLEKGLVKLPLKELMKEPLAFQRRILREAIAKVKGNLRGIEFKHLEGVLRNLREEKRVRLTLPQGVVIFKEYQNLIICFQKELETRPLSQIPLKVPGETEAPQLKLKIKAWFEETKDLRGLKAGLGKFQNNLAFLNGKCLKFPLLLRTWLPGDKFKPLGMKGSKKLQDFLVDEKVPLRKRSKVPIILSGDKIVWVVGHRIDDRFKITEKTQKTLVLEAQQTGT